MKKKHAVKEEVAAMPRVSISERVAPSRVIDKGERWVMPDVILLSEFSQNAGPTGKPRRYPVATQRAACRAFEGLQVNVNHPNPAAGGGRSVLETIGKVTSPRMREAVSPEGKRVSQIVGNLELIKSAASDHVVKLANLDHRLAGMSITGDGEFNTTESHDEVSILTPGTVDVVHRPATTKGFWEAVSEAAIPMPQATTIFDAWIQEKNDVETVDGKGGENPYGGNDAKKAGSKVEDGSAGDVDQEGEGSPDEESKETSGQEAEEATDEANNATNETKTDKTSQAHMKALFCHAGASYKAALGGDQKRAMLHWEKAKEHEMVANKLKDMEGPVMKEEVAAIYEMTGKGLAWKGSDSGNDEPDYRAYIRKHEDMINRLKQDVNTSPWRLQYHAGQIAFYKKRLGMKESLAAIYGLVEAHRDHRQSVQQRLIDEYSARKKVEKHWALHQKYKRSDPTKAKQHLMHVTKWLEKHSAAQAQANAFRRAKKLGEAYRGRRTGAQRRRQSMQQRLINALYGSNQK